MSSNFRHRIVVGIAVAGATFAQAAISGVGSVSVKDRIAQLERISDAHCHLLTQLQQKIVDNQADIDSLRGQIQESQYKLNQVVERQKQILLQMENLSSGVNKLQVASGKQNSASIPAEGTTTAGASKALHRNVDSDYNAAIALVLDKSRQDDAIAALQNFAKKYPGSTYQPNANYWLGQLSYNKGEKDDASYYFAYVVKNYPKSPKAPDAMYKVGLIMQDKGDITKAKAVYRQVESKYPGTSSAKLAQERLHSME